MLDSQAISFLQSPAGSDLLAEAASIEGGVLTRLTRLRRKWSADQASAAVEMLDLRRRGATKFSRAGEMFFTPAGLEQSSGETIARWRADRFPAGARVLDLCCGIGGDAIALAARGPVYAIDRDRATALCAEANLALYQACAAVVCADVTRLRLQGDAAFFDPSRRKGDRRVRGADQYSPPLGFIDTIAVTIPNLAVKVSPALDDSILESFGARLEFVSDRGECKEAILWFGEIGPIERRSATILPANVSLATNPSSPRPKLTEPLSWLYEPDPAVIRAHLIAEVADRLVGASQLDPRIAYLTSDDYVESPFAAVYRVIEWLPFNLKRVQRRLRDLGRSVTAIKRRGVPLEPESLAGRLTGGGDGKAVVVLTRVRGEPAAIICEERFKDTESTDFTDFTDSARLNL